MAENSQQIKEEESKDVLLLKAVDESDVKAVAQLVKCTDELDLEMVRYAHDMANQEGNRLIIRLVAGAVKKMETKKDAVKLSEDSSKHINNNNRELIENLTDLHEEKTGKTNGLNMRTFKFKNELNDPVNHIRIESVGEVNTTKPTKTLLLVGATGAGKTSLISSLLTKVFGIEFKDNFRITFVEDQTQNKTSADSQTECITIYKFYHLSGLNIDYNLTIIDTPGLGDTRGIDYDKLMFNMVEKVFKEDKFGVKEVNCIGLVTMASATRLTTSQTYVYDGCMQMFGKDLKGNIHILATYADSTEPKIADALKAGNVVYEKIHKFNNSSIYLENNSKDELITQENEMYWRRMNRSCSEFLDDLAKIDGIGLIKSEETLKSRRELYALIDKVDYNLLQKIINPEKVQCKEKALNCNTCNITCHQPCNGSQSCQKCRKLIEGTECLVCSCAFENHEEDHFSFKHVFANTDTKTINDLVAAFKKVEELVGTIHEVALNPHTMAKSTHVNGLIKESENIHNTQGNKNLKSLKKIKEQEDKLNIINEKVSVEKLKHQAALSKKGWCSIL